MENNTRINPYINESNNQNEGIGVTVLNNTAAGSVVSSGTVIGGGYKVIGKLKAQTGEADIYVCEKDMGTYAAKIYRRSLAVKNEVIEILKNIESPYVAKNYETGEFGGFPYEITHFYKLGSLTGKTFSFEKLKKIIIPDMNEGLHDLHSKGIIHKDLKPSNIMICDSGKNIVIIDFGISSVRSGANTVLLTKTGMTPEYSAPETFKNLFLEESDYYSFGIMLFELFCGYTPYANMDAEEIERYVSIQKIPFPPDMPQELADLIGAMTYYDITNRREKSNPNRRWTYEEVKKWLNGEKQAAPGETVLNADIYVPRTPPYIFKNIKYTDKHTLINAVAENWYEGKKELYRGILAGYFTGFDQQAARYCADAEDEAREHGADENLIFWKLIYKLAPETTVFYWKGTSFKTLPNLSTDILKKLRAGDTSAEEYCDEILKYKLISGFIEITCKTEKIEKTMLESTENSLLKAVDSVEFMFSTGKKDEKRKVFFLLSYILAEEKIFEIDGKEFKTLAEISEYLKKLYEKSFNIFRAFCHRLIDENGQLNEDFECWLISLGQRQAIANWKRDVTGAFFYG